MYIICIFKGVVLAWFCHLKWMKYITAMDIVEYLKIEYLKINCALMAEQLHISYILVSIGIKHFFPHLCCRW